MKYKVLLSLIYLVSCGATLTANEPALVIDSGGNTRYVNKLLFTKSGQQVVSFGDERVIRVWDLKTGRTIRTIRDRIGPCVDCKIGDIALSPDNAYLAVAGKFPGATAEERFAINIYNFETGERLQELKGHQERVTALVFSADGMQLASGSQHFNKNNRGGIDDPLRVWRLEGESWKPAFSLRGHNETISSVAFSVDGKRLASGDTNGDLFLWTLNSEPAPVAKPLKGHYDAVFGLGFLSDGRLISAALDRRIYAWDAQGSSSKQLGEQPSNIRSMSLNADIEDPRAVVGLEDGSARVISLTDGKVISTFKRDRDQVRAVAFSPVDKNVVASTGGFNGEIWVWNVSNGQTLENGVLAGLGRSIWSVGFSKDGTSLAFGRERNADAPNNYGPLEQVVGFKSTFPAKSRQESAYQISLEGKLSSGDYYSAITRVGEYELRTRYGETLKKRVAGVSFDEPVRLNELFVLRNGQKVSTIERDSQTGRTHLCFTFTPDGRYIVSGGEGGYLAIYDTKNPGKVIHEFYGHTNDVWGVAVSPDGRFVISGSSDQTLKVWDIKSENYVLSIFVASEREWIAWTPQGYYTSSLTGDKYIGWQVEREKNLPPDFYKAEQFQKLFYRPDVISTFLATFDIQTALAQAVSQQSNAFTSDLMTIMQTASVTDNLPPKIEILDLADKLTVTNRLLKVRIRVTSTNLPITSVQVSLNGFQKGTFKGVPDDKEQSRKVEIDMMVALKPDVNTLVVNASHDIAKSQSETRTIYFKAPPGEAPKQKNPDSPNEPLAYFSRINYATRPLISPVAGMNYVSMAAPPTVRIIEPEASSTPTEISAESVPLRVLVPADTEGREIKVKILVNDTEWHKQNIQPGVELPINIALDEDGIYTIKAICIVDGVESGAETRRIKFTNPRPETPNLFFLGIGIKGYRNLEPGLEFADKDAQELANLLSRLKDSPLFKKVETRVLPNEQATRENILKGIEWLNKSAIHDNDVRIVLFSGHGGIFGDPIKKYYFYVQDQVPSEDPEILSPNWDAIVVRLLNRSGRGPVLLFVDTCRAGAGAATPKEFMNSEQLNGLVFFAASGSREKANEDRRWGHGAFTKAVLEGLSGCADTSTVGRPADGMIDFLELGSFIKRRVIELNNSQTADFLSAAGLHLFNIGQVNPTEINCPPPPNQ